MNNNDFKYLPTTSLYKIKALFKNKNKNSAFVVSGGQ